MEVPEIRNRKMTRRREAPLVFGMRVAQAQDDVSPHIVFLTPGEKIYLILAENEGLHARKRGQNVNQNSRQGGDLHIFDRELFTGALIFPRRHAREIGNARGIVGKLGGQDFEFDDTELSE